MRCGRGPSALVPTGIPGAAHGAKPSGSGRHVGGATDAGRGPKEYDHRGRGKGVWSPEGWLPMNTIIERSGPRAFRLCGNVDASNAASVADVLEPHLAEPGDITLDLRELEFMDSVGMGLLVASSKRLEPE